MHIYLIYFCFLLLISKSYLKLAELREIMVGKLETRSALITKVRTVSYFRLSIFKLFRIVFKQLAFKNQDFQGIDKIPSQQKYFLVVLQKYKLQIFSFFMLQILCRAWQSSLLLDFMFSDYYVRMQGMLHNIRKIKILMLIRNLVRKIFALKIRSCWSIFKNQNTNVNQKFGKKNIYTKNLVLLEYFQRILKKYLINDI
eukprot:TRINITY_DN12135_c0_g1_i2.p1 TRINITY_DN12135_c0_g1~~TRINITY_DN12135_c0_g1_i2.p1  ORF type:complete len:199 (-),score=-3.34 TRINITY_DN12135_c0_g1_i2:371-967(-)